MTKSRIASIFSMIVGIATLASTFTGLLPPKYGTPVAAVAMAIISFNERMQGGASDPHIASKAQAEAREKD